MPSLPRIILALILSTVLQPLPTASAQSALIAPVGTNAAPVKIENFGKVNDQFYRGAEPDKSGFEQLAAAGVKTVISLRTLSTERSRRLAEGAGLRYIQLPMQVRHYPPPALAQRFLALVGDPENQPVYVYCHGGRHRTGVLTAVYRMAVEGWDARRAYTEMRRYGFYKRWCHGSLKAYVFDFYRRLEEGAGY
jgi:protein tyrosine/serine phosphatase